jgi:hypothetical protein
MNALRLLSVLCAFALLFALAFAQIAEAKTKTHRRQHFDRYHRHGYEDRRQRASPRVEDFQRDRWNRNSSDWDSSCFNLPYFPAQISCSASGGGAM